MSSKMKQPKHSRRWSPVSPLSWPDAIRNIEYAIGVQVPLPNGGGSPRSHFAITIPCISKELDTVLKALEVWNKPGARPITRSSGFNTTNVPLTIYLDKDYGSDLTSEIKQEASKICPPFFSIHVSHAGLSTEESIYIRQGEVPQSAKLGAKTGPNMQFLRNMLHHRNCGWTLQYECDCTPVRDNWMAEIIELTRRSRHMVHGARYTGPSPMHQYYGFHINGNALYATGHRLFPEYLDVMIESIKACLGTGDNTVAFDVCIDLMLALESLRKADYSNELLYRARNLLPYIAPHPFFANLSGDWETNSLPGDYAKYLHIHKNTLILHSKLYSECKQDELCGHQKIDQLYFCGLPVVPPLNSPSMSLNMGYMESRRYCGYLQLVKKCENLIAHSIASSITNSIDP